MASSKDRVKQVRAAFEGTAQPPGKLQKTLNFKALSPEAKEAQAKKVQEGKGIWHTPTTK